MTKSKKEPRVFNPTPDSFTTPIRLLAEITTRLVLVRHVSAARLTREWTCFCGMSDSLTTPFQIQMKGSRVDNPDQRYKPKEK